MPADQGQYHKVTPDECINSIAFAYGFFWKTLWLHANNKDLRDLRKDPNVLREGDTIFIPAKEEKDENRPVDQTHHFKRKGVPAKLRLRLLKDDEPRKNEPYTVTIDGKIFTGNTDGDGNIEIFIPPGAQSGKLIIGAGDDEQNYDLDLGRMNPASDPDGVMQRLENMGYDCGLDKKRGFPAVLKAFQAANKLPVTGELDDATQAKVVELHGC